MTHSLRNLCFILSFTSVALALVTPRRPISAANLHRASSLSSSSSVRIEADEPSVGVALCEIIRDACQESVTEKGAFSFAISGGSMLKMLANLADAEDVPWNKCSMAFVSHRCVPLDDAGATYGKALPLFLGAWISRGLEVIVPLGSTDSEAEADSYEAALAALPPRVLARRSDSSLPVFDLTLIGVGRDGHVGSIYPDMDDTAATRAVVPVTGVDGMGQLSTKISLSLAAMRASRRAVVACAGKSPKAPLGKAEAMVRALEGTDETPRSFPASALRDTATWLLDEDSAVLLSGTTTGRVRDP
eukprot:CAMPEP_0194304646 /NCGR_PEP_ID=MMETSP0171-20130528/2339_1 /TAXON_ID=218684 /ORGANISM="Corethron pennatum, Strain L29A3" /LENGTH=302 /DNA_ID=CAMNT_0039055985 /DNA_START=31 /DNA_END=939 /DNA_ORIENTATION=+